MRGEGMGSLVLSPRSALGGLRLVEANIPAFLERQTFMNRRSDAQIGSKRSKLMRPKHRSPSRFLFILQALQISCPADVIRYPFTSRAGSRYVSALRLMCWFD